MKPEEFTLSELLGSHDYEVHAQARHLQDMGFPLHSVWTIDLKPVVQRKQ